MSTVEAAASAVVNGTDRCSWTTVGIHRPSHDAADRPIDRYPGARGPWFGNNPATPAPGRLRPTLMPLTAARPVPRTRSPVQGWLKLDQFRGCASHAESIDTPYSHR
jgi:hypothetical protein